MVYQNMLENDTQLEDLFNKISRDEIPLSYSQLIPILSNTS